MVTWARLASECDVNSPNVVLVSDRAGRRRGRVPI
jgi:hypothetical protein